MGELPFGENFGSVKAIPFVRKAYVSVSFFDHFNMKTY